MEALLSLSFDNLSSYDQGKIRKGLRQIDGLLAEICLSKQSPKSSSSISHKRRSSTLALSPDKEHEHDPPPLKQLHDLGSDAAFREFFRLQDGFEWNVASRLTICLDRLLGKSNDGQNDLLIILTLELIQGTLLLHPPSRNIFSRELQMNQLLDLLEPMWCPAIQSSTITTLICALLDTPLNTRTFENLEGLLAITSAFKSRETTRDVRAKLVEFLYFYLMPEAPSIPSADGTVSVPSILQRSPSKLAGAFNGRKRADSDNGTRTTAEKQALLGGFLQERVDDLVADLRETLPFGGAI